MLVAATDLKDEDIEKLKQNQITPVIFWGWHVRGYKIQTEDGDVSVPTKNFAGGVGPNGLQRVWAYLNDDCTEFRLVARKTYFVGRGFDMGKWTGWDDGWLLLRAVRSSPSEKWRIVEVTPPLREPMKKAESKYWTWR